MFVSRSNTRFFAATLLAAAFCLFPVARSVHAQAVAVAEVDGHVSDPSGQPIVGAPSK